MKQSLNLLVQRQSVKKCNGYNDLLPQLEQYLGRRDTWLSRQVMHSNSLLIRHSMLITHSYLLSRELRQRAGYKALWGRIALAKQKQQAQIGLVYQMADNYDRGVIDELNRMESTCVYAMDDYYEYSFGDKHINQIIHQDILLGIPIEHHHILDNFNTYISLHIDYLAMLSTDQLINTEIQWGLPSVLDLT